MKQKWVVYVSYGVYVDTDVELDPTNNDNDYVALRALAVEKMWSAGSSEVSSQCEIEFENVTEEFDQ